MKRTATMLAAMALVWGGSAVIAQQDQAGRTGTQTRDQDFGSWHHDDTQEGVRQWDQGRQQQYGQQQQQGQQYGRQDRQRDQQQDWYQGQTRDQQRFGQQDTWMDRGRDQQQFGQQDTWMDRGRDQQRFGQQGTGQTIALIGRITQDDARVEGVPRQNQVVQLRTRQGQTIHVDLGEQDNVEDLNLSRNQQIFVRGRLTTLRGERVLMAEEVARVSQVTSIDRQRDTQFGYVDPSRQDQQQRFGQQDQQRFGQQQDRWRQQDQQWRQQTDRQQDQQRHGQQDTWRQRDQQGQQQNQWRQQDGSQD